MGLVKLNTLEGVVFWTDVSNFKRIQDFLIEKGFVNSKAWPVESKEELGELFNDTLVYEEKGIGLYRCSFNRKHQNGPLFEFKYWESELTQEQKDRDPMKPVVIEIYRMLKPIRVTDYNLSELDLDTET